jgi:hypothetical protein
MTTTAHGLAPALASGTVFSSIGTSSSNALNFGGAWLSEF